MSSLPVWDTARYTSLPNPVSCTMALKRTSVAAGGSEVVDEVGPRVGICEDASRQSGMSTRVASPTHRGGRRAGSGEWARHLVEMYGLVEESGEGVLHGVLEVVEGRVVVLVQLLQQDAWLSECRVEVSEHGWCECRASRVVVTEWRG